MSQNKSYAAYISLLLLSVACGGGSVKSPKKQIDQIMGKTEKKEEFKANYAQMSGFYALSAIKKFTSNGTTHFVAGSSWSSDKDKPSIVLNIDNLSMEVVSKTETILTTCPKARAMLELGPNRFKLESVEGCPEHTFTVTSQSANDINFVADETFLCPDNTNECTGLTFEREQDFNIGELMFQWPENKSLPPKIAALQISDAKLEEVDAARKGIKDLSLRTRLTLKETISTGEKDIAGNFGVVFINGKLFTINELFANISSIAGTYETSCIFYSKQQEVKAFSQNIAQVEISHVLRKNGNLSYILLHAGLDDILNDEQRRTPTESLSDLNEPKNSIKFQLESQVSGLNGMPTSYDGNIWLECSKDRKFGVITAKDVEVALGNHFSFDK